MELRVDSPLAPVSSVRDQNSSRTPNSEKHPPLYGYDVVPDARAAAAALLQ